MRFSLLRLENIGISLCEFASVDYHRSLFYLGWDSTNGLGFSILWLRRHGLSFDQGLRILDGQYEPNEEDVFKKFRFRLVTWFKH